MAETTTTHQAARPAEHWRCLACAEPWNSVARDEDGAMRCPECRGPLRLVSSPPVYRDNLTERSLVALSDDHQWLAVYLAARRARGLRLLAYAAAD